MLPKVDGAEELKDFRPVSLFHGAVNIFDKVLPLRVIDDLPSLVGVHQSAFVRGRSIHDNFMMVQGTAKKLHSLKKSVVMLKLDISKAFDSVLWPFVFEFL
ncbi:hypothetical protein D1007_42632 [Hordeum vulgare]|nr:hypothetical protein D1007_42632 [Hordeum vulgare]